MNAIGIVFDVNNYTVNDYRYSITRYTGLTYNIYNLIAREQFLRDIFPDLEDIDMPNIIKTYNESIQGSILETFIITELLSHYFIGGVDSDLGIEINTLNYSSLAEVDIVLTKSLFSQVDSVNKFSDLYIEVKRGNSYQPSYLRWLADRCIQTKEEDIRMVLYSGVSCKINPSEDQRLLDIKSSDTKLDLKDSCGRTISLGISNNCGYVYLVNIKDFLLDIDKFTNKEILDLLPEYNPNTNEIEDKNKINLNFGNYQDR